MSDSANPAHPLSRYPVVITVPVQWGDQDAFAHVNNTVFLRWFEIGRIAYFQRLGISHTGPHAKRAPILAAVSCSFERQVTFPDTVQIATRIARIGNKSMVVDHVIYSERHACQVAKGTSTIVYFDYAANESTPLTDEIRAAIQSLEATVTQKGQDRS